MIINESEKLIGLSLGACIRDVLKKEVEIDKIQKIYTGCLWKTDEELQQVLRKYYGCYWDEFDFNEVQEIVNQLLPKISITRLFDPPRFPNIAREYWIDDELHIVWHIYNKEKKEWFTDKCRIIYRTGANH